MGEKTVNNPDVIITIDDIELKGFKVDSKKYTLIQEEYIPNIYDNDSFIYTIDKNKNVSSVKLANKWKDFGVMIVEEVGKKLNKKTI